jgi:hypothetical protein
MIRTVQTLRLVRSAHVSLLLALLLAPAIRAQQPRQPDETAPPPLKIITRVERTQINSSRDEKARVKLSIEFAETHLANAERETSHQQYDVAAAEAGMYWALVEDAFIFMKTIDRDNNRKRDLYKRLELSLRAHGPRLSIMRRGTPSEYAVWIKEIEEFARKGRTEALNSFYGHTVIRDGLQKSTDAKEIEKPFPEN